MPRDPKNHQDNQLLKLTVPQPPDPEQQNPAAPRRARGRPWVKGQSGNPAGRPSRARQAATVAEGLITRKTVALTNKTLELALAGDRMLLRDCLNRIAPPRREPPIDLDLPKIENRADLLVALTAIADAASAGDLTAPQSAALTRMLIALQRATW
jgi:hypothetical protein